MIGIWNKYENLSDYNSRKFHYSIQSFNRFHFRFQSRHVPGYPDPHTPEYNQHPPHFPYEPGGDKQSYPQKYDSTCLSSSAQAGTLNVSFQKRPGDSIPVKPEMQSWTGFNKQPARHQ